MKYSNQTHRSTSDPDARLYRTGKGKESKPSYLVHDLIDTKRARNRVRELRKTRGYQVSRRLRPRSEHTFAEAKTQHGMDRARVRGEARVGVQALLVHRSGALRTRRV